MRARREGWEMPPDIGGPTDGLWAPPADRRTVVEETLVRGSDGRRHTHVAVKSSSSGLSSCAHTDRHWAFAVRECVMMGMVWLVATLGWYTCALLLTLPPFQAFQWKAVGITYCLVVVLIAVLLNGLDTAGSVLFGTAVGLPVLWALAALSVFISPFWGPPAVCAAPFVIGLLGSWT